MNKALRLHQLALPAALFVSLALTGAAAATTQTSSAQQTSDSCNNILAPQHDIDGHHVGQTDCTITNESTVDNSHGLPFHRLDLAISGTAFGYVDPVTQGNFRKDLVDVPDLIFPQFGIPYQWVPATAKYSGSAPGAGAGITVLYPDAGTPWNGKAFVLVHGADTNAPMGDLVPRSDTHNFDLNTYTNLFAGLMIDKGYAVIYTRRPASQSGGVPATLDDGRVLDESINTNVDMVRDLSTAGENVIASKLGRRPSAVYFYGHSSGVMLEHMLNFSDLNYRPDGTRYFDGFIGDDLGGGLPLPLDMKQGEVLGHRDGRPAYNPDDELFQTPESRARFTKELDLAHALYLSRHGFLPDVDYLALKRESALLLQKEGLGSKTRFYEVHGVSHQSRTVTSPPKTLDIGGLLDALIDDLDQWVQKDVAPPPTMSDLPALGGPGTQHPAVGLPPVACPTGVRFPWPPPGGGAGDTGYVPYDGRSPEPVNSQGSLVDLNGNGYRDQMPTMQQAWRQLGLLSGHQQLTKERYVACVTRSADSLVRDRLLPQRVAAYYIEKAQSFPNVPW